MKPTRLALSLSLFLVALAPARAAEVSAENWEGVRDHVLPDEPERRWMQVPWRASLWDAVIDANREEKPILLWAMNGHPLACT